MRVRLVVIVAAVVMAGCAGSPTVTTAPLRSPLPSVGVEEAPEDLFPGSGTTDFDVERYDLDLGYEPETGRIKASAWITAVAAERLDEITVDFGPLEVIGLTVDEAPITSIEQRAGKLLITPARPVAAGARFVIGVAYQGVPEIRADPSLGAPVGWVRTETSSYTNLEPNGIGTWLPANDRPGDKAVFRLRLRVPEPYRAVANGIPLAQERAGGNIITTWDMPEPMAPSELQVVVGRLGRLDTVSPEGLALTTYVAAGAPDLTSALALAGEIADFYGGLFGPYPFAAAGLIASDAPHGLAIPAQGRPVVAAADLAAPLGPRQHGLLATALAHQWFGAAVTPDRWRDIWLGEGFTMYARWLWMEEAGLQRVDDAAANALARTDDMRTAFGPPDRPSAGTLFSPAVVDGGAVALHALRQTVGDTVFFTILRRWVHDHQGQSVTTEEFIDHASAVAGQDLTGLFLTWLSATDVPAEYPNAA